MMPVKLEAFRRTVPVDIEIKQSGFVVEKTYTLKSLTMGQLDSDLMNLSGSDGLKQFVAECSDIPLEILNSLDFNQLKVLVGMIQGVMPDEQNEKEQSGKN